MALVRWTPTPDVRAAMDLMDAVGEQCPYDDCPTLFDPFEIAEHGGIPPHDCGELVPVDGTT